MKNLQTLWRRYREPALYLVFGALTTLVNYGTYLICSHLLDDGYGTTIPTMIAWLISVLFAWITNHIWVFQSQAHTVSAVLKELCAFFGARLLSGLLDLGIMYLAVDRMGHNDKVIKLVSNILIVIINYVLSRFLVFRKKKTHT